MLGCSFFLLVISCPEGHDTMLTFSRSPVVLFALLAAAVAGCNSASSTADAAPHLVGPQVWQVTAGASGSDEALQGLRFYPSSLTIDAGDSIVWSFPALEPHTVSFPVTGATPVPASDPNVSKPYGGTTIDGSAYVSSGFLAGGASYKLTFPKPGPYTYYSLIHQPVAVATVVVQPAGTAYPSTAAAYDTTAKAAITADLGSAQAAVGTFPYTRGGTHVAAGIAPGLAGAAPANATVMRFMNDASMSAGDVHIGIGGTVTWTNESNNVPHDVVFPIAGRGLPSSVTPADPPSGGPTYDGTTLTNSGVIPPGGSYSLTFPKAGVYTYVCVFHNHEHMIGTVTVK
jgi:plastocyanin